MPTYAYACTACDHRFEVQQSFTDASLTECPACDGRVRKLFNAVGIVFKGSGFYRTDSRSGSGSGSVGGRSSGNGDSGSKAAATSAGSSSDSSTTSAAGGSSSGGSSSGGSSSGGSSSGPVTAGASSAA